MSTDLESSLRAAFRQGADALPPTVDPWARTTSAVRRSQVRRRTAALAVATSLLVVGVGAVATGVPSLRADDARVARTPDGGDVQVTTDDLTTWPARGDLVGDPEFLAAAREELGRDGGTVGKLLFAGRVGAQRVAVGVVTTTRDGLQEQEVRAAVEPADRSQSWAGTGYPTSNVQGTVSLALQAEDGSVDLLVLARTDAQAVAYSRAAVYDDQGRPSRTYARLVPRDGVAIARLDPGPVTTISVRVDRRSSSAGPDAVQLVASRLDRPDGVPELATAAAQDARCAGNVSATDVANATTDLWANRDPLRSPAAIEAVWCRDVDGGVVALFGVTLQDGSTFQAQLLEGRRGASTERVTTLGTPVPRGAARTTPAVLRDVPRDGGDRVVHYFVNAPGAATVDVVVDRGAGAKVVTRVRPDRDGFAEVRLAAGQAQSAADAALAEVVLRDGAGREVGRAPLRSAAPAQELDWAVDGPLS